MRSYACEPQARSDELHRSRFTIATDRACRWPAEMTGLLVLGGMDIAEAGRAIHAPDANPVVMTRLFGLT